MSQSRLAVPTLALVVRRSPARQALRNVASCWQLYALILPAFIYIVIFSYGPMYGVQIAFKNFKPSLGIWASPWIGLSHFIRFVTYPDFIRMMRNTLSITLYSLATFPCAIILALLFNEVKNPGYKKTVQMATYAPHFLSTVVLCSLVIMLTGSTGPINSLRTALGATTPTNLLTMPSYFSTIYVWSGVWQNIGWGSIIYIAALAGVSPELIEAARIDGAGRLRIIWHVNIPGILPTIIITLIMSIGTLLTVGFEKIYLLQNSLNLDTSRVISTYTYEIGIIGGQFSYSAAIGLFNNIVNIAMIFIANIVSRRVSDVGLW